MRGSTPRLATKKEKELTMQGTVEKGGFYGKA